MADNRSPNTDIYNQHGARLCDAFGCRKHVRLHQIDDYIFCIAHKRQYEEDNPELILKSEVVPEDQLISQQIPSNPSSSSPTHLHSSSPRYSTNKIDLYTPSGTKLCDAYGCRKTNLQPAYGGMFCPKHVYEYSQIRSRIDPHTGSFDEYQARIEELRFRKQWDFGHPQYAETLGKRYQ